MTRNKAGTEWVKEPSGTRTLARAKTLWQKASGPKPMVGRWAWMGYQREGRKGVRETLGQSGTDRLGSL